MTVPAEYEADHNRVWPMILFLHGGGAPTTEQLKRSIRSLITLPAIVVAPLCPPSPDGPRYTNWDWKQLGAVVREISTMYRTDSKNRAVIGFSMGGSGAWELPSYEPELFAKSRALGVFTGGDCRTNACQPVALHTRLSIQRLKCRLPAAILARS